MAVLQLATRTRPKRPVRKRRTAASQNTRTAESRTRVVQASVAVPNINDRGGRGGPRAAPVDAPRTAPVARHGSRSANPSATRDKPARRASHGRDIGGEAEGEDAAAEEQAERGADVGGAQRVLNARAHVGQAAAAGSGARQPGRPQRE